MSSVLPLKVLGLMGPFLCWVEGGQNPGLPESWHATDFTFEEQVRHWLMSELPTYSYDNLDEVISLAGDRRVDFVFPAKQRRSSARELECVKIPPEGFDLVYVFSQLSKRYFQWAGNELCICASRIVELHELAMRFPVRHLIQYCHADAVTRGYISMERAFELPTHMSQLPTTYRSLHTVVDKGLSEGHLHLNGVINADEAWSDHLLLKLTSKTSKRIKAERDRLLVLSRMAIRLLAVGLIYASFNEKTITLPFDMVVLLDKLYRAKTIAKSHSISEMLESRFLEELETLKRNIDKSLSFEQLQEFEWLMPLIYFDRNFHYIRGTRFQPGSDVFEEIGTRARMRLLKRLHLTVNRILIRNNVRSDDFNNGDANHNGKKKKVSRIREFLHQLAYRYIIYHTHHWQEATQSGKTTGLRKFQSYFNSPQREILSKNNLDFYGLAIERLSMAKPLREVEGRLGPPTTGASKYLPWVLAFALQVEANHLDKFGIVIHFKKENHEKKRWRTDKTQALNVRYGKIRRLTKYDASKLYRLLSTPHPVVPFIVGIDAANLELTTPPEVFAPAFRFLREYPINLIRRNSTKERFSKFDDIAALVKKRRIGMTYHVGEDFRHLLSGLRAIHEVIEFLKPLPGDRLGHAIALALKPEVWAAQVGYQAVMPKLEWLDTLVWLHYLLGPGHDLIGLLAIEDKIQRYSNEVYGNALLNMEDSPSPLAEISLLKACPITLVEKSSMRSSPSPLRETSLIPITLYDAWRLRQLDPYSICFDKETKDSKFNIQSLGSGAEHKRWFDVQQKTRDEVSQHIGTNAAYQLVRLYWFNYDVREKGSRIITIEMQDKKNLWLQVLREAQSRMQEMVREKQLVVEVNPSSNRIIGPMECIADHPIFQLTLDKQHQMEKHIRVTINTDNPGVFATSLPHEFYLLGESLLARGVSEPEVVEWLDWLRGNGKEYSFLNGLENADNLHMRSLLNSLLSENVSILDRLKGRKRSYKPSENCNQAKRATVAELNKLKERIKELEEMNR